MLTHDGPLTGHVHLGAVEVSLSDMKSDATKPFQWIGTARATDEDVIDARWDACNPASAKDVATTLARCLCELAVYFRDARGGVILVLNDEVRAIEPLLA